jgi:hypothetical protein
MSLLGTSRVTILYRTESLNCQLLQTLPVIQPSQHHQTLLRATHKAASQAVALLQHDSTGSCQLVHDGAGSSA